MPQSAQTTQGKFRQLSRRCCTRSSMSTRGSTCTRTVSGPSTSSRANGGPKATRRWSKLRKKLAHKAGMKVHFHWVKGHAGHEGNEKADTLAEAGKEAEEPSGGRTLPYTVLTSGTGRSTDHTADHLVTAMKEAAKTTIPYHRRVPRTPWISDETLTALEESRRAEVNCSETWRTLRNRAKRLARKDRVNWVHRQLESDPGAVSSTVWNVVRRQRNGFVGKRTHLIKDGVPQPWTLYSPQGV